jgi:agmatinase
MRDEPLQPTVAPERGFLDWPIVTDPRDWQAEVALIGLPHSEPYASDPHPNDQARAPEAVRRQSHQISDGADHWNFDLGAALSGLGLGRCIDCGDLPWTEGPYDAHAARATGLLRRLFRNRTQVFVLGGDHGVTIPVLDALEAVGEPVHVVQIDAHLDWRAEVGGIRRGYSSPMAWASRLPWISGMTQIGLRGTGSARRAEVEAARAYGSLLVTAERVHADGLGPVLAAIPEAAPIYLTIDADGLDPSEMPGVLGPAPGGLRFAQVAPFLRALARRQRVVGCDVVEVAPSFDSAGAITAITAGRLILQVLGASRAGASG